MSRHTSILASLCFCVCILFNSCSVEKRIYRKGYHVVWNHKKSNEQKKAESAGVLKMDPPVELLAASELNQKEIIPLKQKPVLLLDKDTCGDKLLLQNADELLVRILEIDEHTIKYKRCDNPNGPTYSISKSKVALITYANGTKEVVMSEPPVKNTPNKNTDQPQLPRKINPLGLASLLIYVFETILLQNANLATITGSMLLLLFLLSILPLILAYISLFQFKREPTRYKGKWMPITVVCFYLASLLILMLVFASLSTLGATGVGPFITIFLLIFIVLLAILIAALIPKANPSNVR